MILKDELKMLIAAYKISSGVFQFSWFEGVLFTRYLVAFTSSSQISSGKWSSICIVQAFVIIITLDHSATLFYYRVYSADCSIICSSCQIYYVNSFLKDNLLSRYRTWTFL